MRLNRLELQGFKSFVDRTILTFQPGITGVVGPNGCGKSNIVDAIQWVMGEQSAKHLRGDSMVDVIFNGSDSRPAASTAEVSLILDRMGVALAPQFAAFDKGEEISITRRVYRDGTGEYLINKIQCRLKDIHELFMDTGVGKRAYSIIEQGQIDRMINVKPEDRRLIFEEVAGITKYKAKRKEAERKLEATRGNLQRLQDIILELEKQIRSLKIQATRARKYKELKGELETVDLYLLGRNLYTHKKALVELDEKKQLLVTERSESDAKYAQVDAEVTTLDITRIDQEKTFKELTDRDHELSLLIQKMEGQLTVLEERKKYLEQSCTELAEEETELRGKLDSLITAREAESAEQAQLKDQLQALEHELSDSEGQIRLRQDARHRATQKRDQLQSKKVQLSHRAVSLQNQRLNLDSKEKEIVDARAELNQKLTQMVVQIESQKQLLLDADAKIEAVTQKAAQAEQEVSAIHSECQSISAELSRLEEELFTLREGFHTKKSRLESLRELQENLEGYSPTAREVLLKLSGENAESLTLQATPLAEVVQPDAEIEESLEALLGADMNTLLVNSTSEAEALARLVNGRDLEKVKIVAMSELASFTQAAAPGGCIPLLSKIRVTAGFDAAANRWFGSSFIVDSPDKVFELRQQYPNYTFLTRDSRTIGHGDRSLSSGVAAVKTGVFARRREIESLAGECAALESDVNRVAREREVLLEKLQDQETLHSEMKDKLSHIHIERVECRKEKESVNYELNRVDREYSNVMSQCDRNTTQLEGVKEQMNNCDADLAVIVEDEQRIGDDLTVAEAEIVQAGTDLEDLVTGINDKKIERSRVGEKVASIEYKLQRTESELSEIQTRIEDIVEQQDRDKAEAERLAEEYSTLASKRQGNQEEKATTSVRINDVGAAFNETCSTLQVLREQKESLQKRREVALSELQEVELKLTQEQSNYEHLCGISVERYHREPTPLDDTAKLDIATLPLFAEQMGSDWDALSEGDKHALLQEHLKNMREKIGRYGEVNLTAIQEFDEIQKRYDFLMEQKTDLEKSISILEEAIVKIDETTKVKFEETFNAVNSKFQEIFPILFNGGKAELTLVHSEVGKEVGVDIMAQPPGKRLQSITLLSGGEKALTAVSLVLGIFARKPSPFCLLDEVDAPLDDANVSRFNTVIRKMAEKTQFIVITHNKKTMEIAEALYGVTMEKAGVSKMTSVRLQ